MAENENIENNVAAAAEIAPPAHATAEFTNTIVDSCAPEASEAETEADAPVLHDGPIQTVGRRKRAIARVRMVAGSGEIIVNGRSLDDYFPNKLHQQDV